MPDTPHSSDRPDVFHSIASSGFEVVESPRGVWQRIWDNSAVRKTVILVLLAMAWEVYGLWLGKPLLFPRLSDTVRALISAVASGELPKAAWFTVTLLLKGY